MSKTRINISIDQDLADFIKNFAGENRTSVADIITQYVLNLKRNVEGEQTEVILAHPAFKKTMAEAQARLKEGKAVWHNYDEVFSD